MPKKKRHLTSPPLLSPRRKYCLHPMSVPRNDAGDREGYFGRSHVWVLTLESPYGALVDCYDDNRANAVAQASALLGRCAVMGQKSELSVRLMNGRFGEARTFPRSSDPKRSKG